MAEIVAGALCGPNDVSIQDMSKNETGATKQDNADELALKIQLLQIIKKKSGKTATAPAGV